METSLKTGFAQIFSCCPKNLSCPKFGRPAAPSPPPPRPPGPYTYVIDWRTRASRRDEAIKQKAKLPEKDFAKNELQTPQRALMTILVSLLHFNIVKRKIEFD